MRTTVLVLASLLIVTIQAENMALSSSAAEIPSLITGRWGVNAVGPGGNRLRLEPAGQPHCGQPGQ